MTFSVPWVSRLTSFGYDFLIVYTQKESKPFNASSVLCCSREEQSNKQKKIIYLYSILFYNFNRSGTAGLDWKSLNLRTYLGECIFYKYTFTKWNRSVFILTGNACFPCISYLLFIFLSNMLYVTRIYAYKFLLQQVLAGMCIEISLLLLKSVQSGVCKLLLSIKQTKNENEFSHFLNFFFLCFIVTMLELYK